MYKNYIKRILDFVFSLLAMPFLLIIILCTSLWILYRDKGPVFYKSLRLGLNGKPFKMFKFRTMIVDAPDIRLDDGSTYNADDDPRITVTGRLLRKTSIDEIPQILNIFLGDMSFIGPRPDPIDSLESYTEDEKVILSIKPGLTGYNQAYFRNSVNGATKLKNDIFYTNNISFILDLKIFLKTIKTVFRKEHINKNK